MASYLGTEFQNTPVQSAINAPLIQTVLLMKQGQYDTVKSSVQQGLDQLGQIAVLRPEDQQYINQKITSLTEQLNSMGTKNLADPSVSDKMFNAIRSTARDPFVLNAIEQTQKYRNFNLKVDELKKKSPDKYSDINYQDALDQAGFDAYKNGETNKIGNLEYKEYINLPEIHSKRLKDYVAQYDDEQYLGTESHKASGLHTVDIYGKRVLKEDLVNFLNSSMDSKEVDQLMINTRASLKSLPQSQVLSLVKSDYESNLENLKKSRAELKAQIDSGQVTDGTQALKQFDERITSISNKIENNSFDQSDIYSLMKEQYIDRMASNFDKNIITKKDIDDTLFQIDKYEYQKKKDALDYDLKLRELATKEREVQAVEAQALGTQIEKTQQPDAQERSQYKEVGARLYQITNQLKESIAKNDPKFSAMTGEEQLKYISSLDLSNSAEVKTAGLTAQDKKLLTEFKQLQSARVKSTQATIKAFQPTVISSFFDMQDSAFAGSELDLENVSEYLPTTATIIKDAKKKGKKITWENIPTDQRYAIQVEFLNAYTKQNSGKLSEDEKSSYNMAILSMKNKIKDKKQREVVKQNITKVEENKGVFGELWSNLKGAASEISSGLGDLYDATLGWTINAAKEGTNYADKVYNEEVDRRNKNASQGSPTLRLLGQSLGVGAVGNRVFSRLFSEDENLSNIEARDLLGRENIQSRFNITSQALKSEIQRYYDSTKPNLSSSYAYSFSTDNKVQKPIAELLRQTILSTEEGASANLAPIREGNNYTIEREGTGFKISYLSKGEGKTPRVVDIRVDKLPAQLDNIVNKKEDNWNRSIYNPLLSFKPIQVTPITTYKDSENRINNIVKFAGDLSSEVEDIISDYKNGIFKPSFEYVRQDIKEDIYNKNKQIVDRFLNQKFNIKTGISNRGILQSTISYTDLDGKENVYTFPHNLIEKDDERILLDVYTRISDIKKLGLSKLK